MILRTLMEASDELPAPTATDGSTQATLEINRRSVRSFFTPKARPASASTSAAPAFASPLDLRGCVRDVATTLDSRAAKARRRLHLSGSGSSAGVGVGAGAVRVAAHAPEADGTAAPKRPRRCTAANVGAWREADEVVLACIKERERSMAVDAVAREEGWAAAEREAWLVAQKEKLDESDLED